MLHHIISDLVEGNGQPTPKPSLVKDRSRKDLGGIGGYVPGRLDTEFEEGVARKIPAGSDIVLQMHYTTIGMPVSDRLQIGVKLAKEPPTKLRAAAGGQMPNTTFAIPPGAANYEVMAKQTFDKDTYLNTMYPHMHVRGKDVIYKAVYPDGKEEVLLSVPKYDFNWQMTYKLAEPKLLPKGTTLMVVAHYDNSTANRFNPDPTATVRWGDQTWEEMLIGYFGTVSRTGGQVHRQQHGQPLMRARVSWAVLEFRARDTRGRSRAGARRLAGLRQQLRDLPRRPTIHEHQASPSSVSARPRRSSAR